MIKEYMDYIRSKLGEREYHEYRQQFARNHEMQFILAVLDDLKNGRGEAQSTNDVKHVVKRGRPFKTAASGAPD